MKRSEFFKSAIGLIGIVGSLKELSLINTPVIELLPAHTRMGDLVMNRDNDIFYYDGKYIRHVSNPRYAPMLAKAHNSESKYMTFSRACPER